MVESAKWQQGTMGMTFQVTLTGGSIAVSMTNVQLPDAGIEDVSEFLAGVANIAEVAALGACAFTGVACAAVPVVSGVSTTLDGSNLLIDVSRRQWNEAFLDGISVAGGVASGTGAKAFKEIGGSEMAFKFTVGGGFDGTMIALSGSSFYQAQNGIVYGVDTYAEVSRP